MKESGRYPDLIGNFDILRRHIVSSFFKFYNLT